MGTSDSSHSTSDTAKKIDEVHVSPCHSKKNVNSQTYQTVTDTENIITTHHSHHWYWQENDKSYKPFDNTTSYFLHELNIGAIYTMNIGSTKYEITKISQNACKQKNTKTDYERNVIRKANVDDNKTKTDRDCNTDSLDSALKWKKVNGKWVDLNCKKVDSKCNDNPRVATKYMWYWQDNDESYKPFTSNDSKELDKLVIGDVYTTQFGNARYEITKILYNECQQKNSNTNYTRKVIGKVKLPQNDNSNNTKYNNDSGYHWYWQNDKKSYQPFSDNDSCILDQLNIGNVHEMYIGSRKYEITKISQNICKQKNTKTDYERNVIRKAKGDDNKDESKNEDYINKVNELFFASLSKSKYKIIDVKDITKSDNANIYEKIVQEKCKNGRKRDEIERYLWHGTKNLDNLKLICQNGFDRSYNTTSMYGKGTYFARDSKYSVNGYCGKDDDGIYSILLCKVIVGAYTVGKKSMKTIPRKNDGSEYETLVNNIKDPSIFVVWRDYHSIPCYLVKYK